MQINSGAFESCTRLTTLTFPNNLTRIGSKAFFCCSGLNSLSFNDGLVEIGPQAFGGCSGLTSITIPSSVTTIGDNAFDSSQLTSLTFNTPSSLISIGTGAFQAKDSTVTVTIPASVTKLWVKCFNNFYPANVSVDDISVRQWQLYDASSGIVNPVPGASFNLNDTNQAENFINGLVGSQSFTYKSYENAYFAASGMQPVQPTQTDGPVGPSR